MQLTIEPTSARRNSRSDTSTGRMCRFGRVIDRCCPNANVRSRTFCDGDYDKPQANTRSSHAQARQPLFHLHEGLWSADESEANASFTCLQLSPGVWPERYHCKNCGDSVCVTCCPDRIKLPNVKGYEKEPQRVCSRCCDNLLQPVYVPAERSRNTPRPPTAPILPSYANNNVEASSVEETQRIVNDRLRRRSAPAATAQPMATCTQRPAGGPMAPPPPTPPPYNCGDGWGAPPPYAP